MPFNSPKQEAFMWAKHPDIARRWVHEHGHAKGWKNYQKNVIPKNRKSRARKKRKGAAMEMPKLTYSQVVDEAVAALTDGQLDVAADLFAASMNLRYAERCEACGGKKSKLVWTCKACGGKMVLLSKASDEDDNTRGAAKLKYETRKNMKDKSFACPSSHPKVKGNKDHFPIQDLAHGRNALSRVGQYDSAPPWWSGSLEELKNTVTRAVRSRYPALTKRSEERNKD